ncbi:hypothetical protein I6A60_13550 [Frankia sp. AgB1.9]|uniref:hypothetical protein n=1 Tax=unclassified Frankia TaxID=2632575 RepID=UPI00193290AB|nr:MULTISPECIES: hypothetical protein [unclassified Frankia]MBL7494147.1 hypothetical protein [Frankia sp. AgW1.1]MBL7548896.1 hypothetical protein [Frankia sp. AgB1.9]MBL7625201.1 hypothetical protein [Frankia sp. AgB1.8]
MASVPRPDGPPQGNPRAYVTATDDRHTLTVLPGAEPDDVATALESIPPASFLTFDRSPLDRDGVALQFRAQPDEATAVTDPPTVPAPAWTPTVAPDVHVPSGVLGDARWRHDRAAVPAWWTTIYGTIVAGPWADRYDATDVGAGDPDARAAYGVAQPDATVATRHAPDQIAWDRHLAAQTGRLRDHHGGPLAAFSDDLSRLAFQVGAALVAAGIPLADLSGIAPHGGALVVPARRGSPAGVALDWLTDPHRPALDSYGDHASVLPDVMGYALASLLGTLGFRVGRGKGTRSHLVTAAPTP